MNNSTDEFAALTKDRSVDVTLVHAPGGHGGYSADVAAIVNTQGPVAPVGAASDVSVIAICTYTPSFFYRRIVSVARNATAPRALRLFETQHGTWLPQVQPSAEQEEKEAQALFDRSTLQEFRHFASLREHADRVLRLCCFTQAPAPRRRSSSSASPSIYHGGDKASEWPVYFDWFLKHNEAYECFAFFNWLSRDCRCYVVPPNCWSQWGLPHPRDCAIIHDRFLVELFPEYEAYVLASRRDDGTGWSWPFFDVPLLLRQVASADYDQLWSPTQFLQHIAAAAQRRAKSQITKARQKRVNAIDRLKKKIEDADLQNAATKVVDTIALCDDVDRLRNLDKLLAWAMKQTTDDHDVIEKKLRAWTDGKEVDIA